MQFKYPEIFWALFLLLIPIIVHFIQLRRFRKTSFTNVRLLKKVTAQSSKTRTLKKWLLLFSRLFLLAMLITAFAGPYRAQQQIGENRETLIYLDNSFSLQLRNGDQSLLEYAIQELVQGIPESKEFTLFTNDKTFKKARIKNIQNELLNIEPTYKQLDLQDILFKAGEMLASDMHQSTNLILLSDLQNRFIPEQTIEPINGISSRLVSLTPDEWTNIALDSAYIAGTGSDQIELVVFLKTNSAEVESVPVSLFNGETLIAKSAASFEGTESSELIFTLPAEEITNGRIEILDAGLAYDNVLYFSIPPRSKTRIMVIGQNANNYLDRIYVADEFDFSYIPVTEVNYSELALSSLIVLDELRDISTALENAIQVFVENGGSVVVIPGSSIEPGAYNRLLSKLGLPQLDSVVPGSLNITDIEFDHPLYRDVFEKRVTNFDYPMASSHYSIKGSAPQILGFQNSKPFLLGDNGRYLFTSPLSIGNGTFVNNSLVVPTFYSIAWNSLKTPALYQNLSELITTDIPWVANADEIIKLRGNAYEFIPLQKKYANKTTLTLVGDPRKDGNYMAISGEEEIMPLSFNYPREESVLIYSKPDLPSSFELLENMPEFIASLEKEGRVNELWKWFVIFALVFALAEVLIQKLVK
ncbi:BatA domain-containing protein [Lentiprolixibacter aurantiacus]|uniref:BatA domain-containing protein n=1 Tax=Lentiprolixibacter aurantiacus TaxID=2993939 RepID=A0AAE3MLA5_9FLAO|nr:BatA domain-containing protein [Lentiprolixibacter aurantiacus]MCX2719488.1 BatA domain-containing protein [Lentiprolixibacter aurantiacus]